MNYNTDGLIIPSHSVEAEQSVLGGLMIDNSLFDEVSEIVKAADFYRADHRKIFETITTLSFENNPSDAVTISEILENQGKLDDIGGLKYLGTLAKNTPTEANTLAYARIVRERAISRALLRAGAEIQGLSSGPEKALEKLDKAQSLIMSIHEDTSSTGPVFIRDQLGQFVDDLEVRFSNHNDVTGMETGFAGIDKRTTGLQDGEFIIIAGRPSMGKTSLAMNIAEHQSINLKNPVLVFSMEMPEKQLTQRIISSRSGVNMQKIRNGQLSEIDWTLITRVIPEIQKSTLMVDDTPGLTINQVRARSRKAKREHDIKLIIIDYLQLMQWDHGDSKANEIGKISQGLKNIARELNLPVIALSQLNRSLEQRPNKRPVMSDLRDSGSLEQDADLIMFVYRDEVYNPDSKQLGTAEIITGKQRNGPIGIDRLVFKGQNTKFSDHPDNYGDGHEAN